MKNKEFNAAKSGFLEIVKCLALAGVVVAAVALCVCHASCQLTSQGIQALDAEESPQITGVSILSASSIEVDFSKAVSVQNASVSRLALGERASIDMAAQNPVKARVMMSRDDTVAVYVFEKATEIGERYQLFSEIRDARGNSLTFALPFDGFNERLPYCVLAEVQPSSKAATKKYAAESPYVTIRALEDGNLFGMELYCAANKRGYPFPKVEVKAGQEITLHLNFTATPEDCADELGDNLALAKTGRSLAARRDLFFETSGTALSSSNDVILLLDRNSNKALDALSYFTIKNNSTSWNLPEAAQRAERDGAWQGNGTAESAFLTNDPANKASSSKPLIRARFPSASERRPSSKYDWTVFAGKSVYE